MLRDGNTALCRLQRKTLPGATVVLDWWHAAEPFEHTLQAARGLDTDTAATPWPTTVRGLEDSK